MKTQYEPKTKASVQSILLVIYSLFHFAILINILFEGDDVSFMVFLGIVTSFPNEAPPSTGIVYLFYTNSLHWTRHNNIHFVSAGEHT